jgi:transposase
VEIITGVERRRRWRLDEKLRIVAEAEAPGACFVEIARRHDVSRGLLWHWRRQVRSGELRPVETTSFLPVQVMPDVAAATPASVAVPVSTRPRRQATADETIEITLPDGTSVRVGRNVGAVALRRVLGVLRG